MFTIFQFDEDGNLIHWGGQPILLNSSVIRDPEVVQLLEKYRPAVEELTEKVLGVSKVLLDGSKCRAVECNIGNMISDALIYTRVNQFNGTRWTDASIAFVQGGGIRASARVGNVTKFDLKTILPFGNTLLVMNMTGTIVKQALERAVEQFTGDRGEFLQMSGLRVVYNMSKPSGQRVDSVDVLCSDCDVPVFNKLDLNREYGVIMSDFIYEGGDGFTMFKVSFFIYFPKLKQTNNLNIEFIVSFVQGIKTEDMKLTEFDAVINYMQNVKTLYPFIEGRVTMIGKQTNNEKGGSTMMTASITLTLFMAITLLNYIY